MATIVQIAEKRDEPGTSWSRSVILPACTMWPIVFSIAIIVLELAAKVLLIGIILVRGRGRPTARLTWIVIILAVPLLGICLYVLVGEVRPGQRRVQRHRAILDRLATTEIQSITALPAPPPPIAPEFNQIATLAEAVGGRRPCGGNAMELISNADDFVRSLVADIESAQHHCHLLFYIFLDDSSGQAVAAALRSAAANGVKCRLLVDAVGSREFAQSALRRELEQGGVQVVEALPANLLRVAIARIDLRNHRKIVVIDGTIAYMGSQNIAHESFAPKPEFAPWVDAMVRVTGPLVHDLQFLFICDWNLDHPEPLERLIASGPPAQSGNVVAQVMGSGPNFYNEALRQLIHTSIHAARQEIIMTTPYFVPDEATVTALCTAARRGVETSLVVPARNDSPLVGAASRGMYEPLLESGVEIYEFQEGLLHAKTLTLDRSLALVSSANLDRRSFELNFEVNMLIYSTDFASQLRFLQRSYQSLSKTVSLSTWRRRPWTARLVQNTAATLAPLL